MNEHQNGRLLIDMHKQALRDLVSVLAKDGQKDTSAAILAALGEVTAEVGVGVVGHKMTIEMFMQLAKKVKTSS